MEEFYYEKVKINFSALLLFTLSATLAFAQDGHTEIRLKQIEEGKIIKGLDRSGTLKTFVISSTTKYFNDKDQPASMPNFNKLIDRTLFIKYTEFKNAYEIYLCPLYSVEGKYRGIPRQLKSILQKEHSSTMEIIRVLRTNLHLPMALKKSE